MAWDPRSRQPAAIAVRVVCFGRPSQVERCAVDGPFVVDEQVDVRVEAYDVEGVAGDALLQRSDGVSEVDADAFHLAEGDKGLYVRNFSPLDGPVAGRKNKRKEGLLNAEVSTLHDLNLRGFMQGRPKIGEKMPRTSAEVRGDFSEYRVAGAGIEPATPRL